MPTKIKYLKDQWIEFKKKRMVMNMPLGYAMGEFCNLPEVIIIHLINE